MLKKNIVNDILQLSLPVLAEMLIYTFMWMFDMIMIGKYGGNVAVTTVGICDEIMYTWINICISTGLSIGITSLIARRVGGNHIASAEEYASIGLITGFFISLVICMGIYFGANYILIFAGAKREVLSNGIIYLKITSFGIFFNMLTNIVCSILRGYGNTKLPMFTAAIISVLKLFLDWVLIFGKFGVMQYGIRGPAYATAFSELIGFIYIFIFLINKSQIKIRLKYIFSINFFRLKQLLLLSIPSSMEEAAFSISRLLSNIIIMHAGTVAFAANQIANTIESVSFMPGVGFGLASTTLVGLSVGKKDYRTAKRYTYVTTLITTFMMLTCSVIFLIIPDTLVSMFIKGTERDAIHLASACLAIGAFEQPTMAISMVLGGSLKGYGDTKSPFLVSFISSWCIRLPMMFYFIGILKWSVIYVWWITAIQWCFNAVIMIIIFKSSVLNKC